MGLFGKKKRKDVPVIDTKAGEPVIRCSICTGEQVLCLRDRNNGKLIEIMLIREPADLEAVCEANGLDPQALAKVY